jgi:hypothetical protein
MIDQTGTLLDCPIKSFQLFKPTRLPPKVAREWKIEWKPIFDLMESHPDIDLTDLSNKNLKQSFALGTEHVRSQAEYIWYLPNQRIDTWTIGQWSKMVKYSNIAKNGTRNDKQKLPPHSFRNNPRPRRCQRQFKSFSGVLLGRQKHQSVLHEVD